MGDKGARWVELGECGLGVTKWLPETIELVRRREILPSLNSDECSKNKHDHFANSLTRVLLTPL